LSDHNTGMHMATSPSALNRKTRIFGLAFNFYFLYKTGFKAGSLYIFICL
jgi:hypothetical protein